jgi:hypothetical protein
LKFLLDTNIISEIRKAIGPMRAAERSRIAKARS